MSEGDKYKTCSGKNGCGDFLPYDAFGVDKRTKSGRKTVCKECEKKYKKNYYLKNKENTYYVTYKNVLEEETDYTVINSKDKSLTSICYEFARTCGSDELYDAVMKSKVHLLVNDELVAIEEWHKNILKDDDRICIVSEVAISGIAAAIAAIVATTSVYGGAGLIVASYFTLVYTVAYIAIYAIFSLAVSFLSSLLTPDTPDMSFSAGKATQTYNWSGIRTVARINSPIPVLYGTRLLGGNIISIETEGENNSQNNYLNMLLALCEGEIEGICQLENVNEVCTTSDRNHRDYVEPYILLDDQPINNYKNVEWWYRTGTNTATFNVADHNVLATYNQYDIVAKDGAIWECQRDDVISSLPEPTSYAWKKTFYYPFTQTVIPHFHEAAIQHDDGRTIDDNWVVYTTVKEVDKLFIQVRVPQLYQTSDEGVDPAIVDYTIEYKPLDGGVWYKLAGANEYIVRTTGLPPYESAVTSGEAVSLPALVMSEIYEEIGISYPLIDDLYMRFFAFGDGKYTHTSAESAYDKVYYVEVVSNGITVDPYGNIYDNIYEKHCRVYDANNNIVEEDVVFTTTISQVWHENTGPYDPIPTGYITLYFPVASTIANGAYMGVVSHNTPIGCRVKVDTIQNPYRDNFQIRAKTKTGVFGSHELDCNGAVGTIGKAIYQIRVKRTDGGTSVGMGASDELFLSSVTEIVYGSFRYPNTALLGFRIKADDQLSGQPPNINVLVKGTKVPVPSLTGSEAFDDMFWNPTTSQWENATASITRSWNEETWQTEQQDKEFTDNFIVISRDLLTHERYGLGKYMTTDDIDEAGFVKAIKECHKKYEVFNTDNDYFLWWDTVASNMWTRYVTYDGLTNTGDVYLDKDTRDIRIYTDGSERTSDSSNVAIKLNCIETLKKGNNYTLTCSIDSVTHPINTVNTYIQNDSGVWGLVDSSTTVGNGIMSSEFTANTNGCNTIMVNFIRNENATTMTSTICRITDVHLNWVDNKYDHYHTFDGVFETSQSAMSVVLELCEGYRTWPVWKSGGLDFVMDTDETPVHTLSMNNMIEFTQSFTPLSEIPSVVSAQFSNETNDYDQEIIQAVSEDTSLNELNEKVIGLKGITDIRKAEREALWKLNKVTNCTHAIQVKCGLDMLHAIAGDIINVQHDLPSWGQGGMILDYNSVNSSIIIDKSFDFTATNSTASYLIKYKRSDNSFVTASLDVTATGETQNLTVTNWVGSPCEDSTYALGDSNNYVKPFRIMRSVRTGENEVDSVLLEHVTSLYTEPVLKYRDTKNYSSLPNKLAIPPPPVSCRVEQTSIGEGLGFIVSAGLPKTDCEIKDIVVEMSESMDNFADWIVVAHIPYGQSSAVYINENLKTLPPNNVYQFRFYCRTQFKNSTKVYVMNVVLDKEKYTLPAPTGLHVKYFDPNDVDDEGRMKWDGNDITFVWNPSGGQFESLLKNYKLEIYHDEISSSNLLTVRYSNTPEYTYFQDTSPYYSHLVVRLYSVSVYSTESARPTVEHFINTAPSTPINLSASPLEDAVKFMWDLNSEVDVVGYNYSTKVDSGSWSSWSSIDVNEVTRELTNYEIGAQGYGQSNIAIRLKALDKYGNLSATSNVASIACYNFKPEITVSPTPGLGHFTTIASAVNAASVNGGKILLKEGTHQLTASILFPDVPIIVEGVDKESVIVRNSINSNLFAFSDTFGQIDTYNSNFEFKKFTIESQNVEQPYSKMFYMNIVGTGSMIIDDVNITLATDFAPPLSKNYALSDIGIYHFGSFGDTPRLTIRNCNIRNGHWGILGYNYYDMDRGIFIHDNIFTNQYYYGVNLGEVHNFHIYNNQVVEFHHRGIYIANYVLADIENPNLYVQDNLIMSDNTSTTASQNTITGIGAEFNNDTAGGVITGNSISIFTSRQDLNSVDGIANVTTYNARSTNISHNTIIVDASVLYGVDGISVSNEESIISNNIIVINNTKLHSSSANSGIDFHPHVAHSCLVSNNYIDLINNTASDIGIVTNDSSYHHGGGNIIKDCGIGIQANNSSHSITATYITS